MKKVVFIFLLLAIICSSAFSQSTTPEEYTDIEFSPVLHSIRRTEIITLGSLPFTVLLSNLGYQIIRIAFINPDAGFVNPIAKSSSSSNAFTEKEQIGILIGGVSLSLCVGLTDTIISVIKKNKQAKQIDTYDADSNVHIDVNERLLPQIKVENPFSKSEDSNEETIHIQNEVNLETEAAFKNDTADENINDEGLN